MADAGTGVPVVTTSDLVFSIIDALFKVVVALGFLIGVLWARKNRK